MGKQVAFEAPVVRRPLDPHVARAPFVAKMREDGGLPKMPVGLAAALLHQGTPFLAERHRRVHRHVAPARPVQFAQGIDGGDGRDAASPGLEVDRLQEKRRKLAQSLPAVGSTDQRVLLGKIGDDPRFAARAQQLVPTNRSIDRSEPVDTTIP